MDESNLSHITDNSLFSGETEANSINNSSSENKQQLSLINETQIIKAIVTNLNDIIEENRKRINIKYITKDNLFYLDQLPNISLGDYIIHLMKYTHISISTLILAVIYRTIKKEGKLLSIEDINKWVIKESEDNRGILDILQRATSSDLNATYSYMCSPNYMYGDDNDISDVGKTSVSPFMANKLNFESLRMTQVTQSRKTTAFLDLNENKRMTNHPFTSCIININSLL